MARLITFLISVMMSVGPMSASDKSGLPVRETSNHSAATRDKSQAVGATLLGPQQELIDKHYAAGKRYFNEGDLNFARREFKAILEIQPNHPLALSYLGQVEERLALFIGDIFKSAETHFANGDFETAQNDYAKVLVFDPDHPGALEGLRRVQKQLSSMEKEKHEEARVKKARPIFAKAWQAYKDQDYEKALPLWNKVLEEIPEHPEANHYQTRTRQKIAEKAAGEGRRALDKGQMELAEKYFARALDMDPNHGEAAQALRDIEAAMTEQRKARSQHIYRKGLEAFTAGREQEAVELWRKAIELDAENIDAQRGLQRLQNESHLVPAPSGQRMKKTIR